MSESHQTNHEDDKRGRRKHRIEAPEPHQQTFALAEIDLLNSAPGLFSQAAAGSDLMSHGPSSLLSQAPSPLLQRQASALAGREDKLQGGYPQLRLRGRNFAQLPGPVANRPLIQRELAADELQAKFAQRDVSQEEALQAKPLVQRAGGGFEAGAEFEHRLGAARGGAHTRDFMEQCLGADFSRVRAHTDAQVDQLNQSIQAKAFTTGQDLFFRQGAYQPGSQEGQALIAHELTHVVQQRKGIDHGSGIQRVEWGGDRTIASLDLTQITSNSLLHDAEEDGGVWRIELPSGSYILKGTSEGAKKEIFATTLAGVLGANTAALATKKLTKAEAEKLESVLETGEETDIPEEDDKVLIMQDLGGMDLNKLKEENDRYLLARDYVMMGKMATIDIIIGIGDRFNIGGTGMVNLGNIVLGTDGNLHPIDYDIGQSDAVNEAETYDKLVKNVVKDDGETIVELVTKALKTEDDGIPDRMVLYSDDEISAYVKRGMGEVLGILATLTEPQINEIATEANKVEKEGGYGEQVGARIKSMAGEKVVL